MGQAKVPRHHPKGGSFSWAQRDFEERPMVFLIKNKAYDPVCKRLAKKINSIEKKFEKINPKAKLTLANLTRMYEKYQTRFDNRVKSFNSRIT